MMRGPVAAIPFVLLLGGCISSPYGLNNDLTVGGHGNKREPSYTPETLQPTFGAPQAQPAQATAPAPTTLGIARDNWSLTRVDVPNDRPAHQPIYTRNLLENDEIARNRGVYPTAQSANQISHASSEDAQRLEALEAPVAAAADIVLWLPRAIMDAPWDTVYTGFEPYRRTPSPRASVSLVLAGPQPEPMKPARGGMADPAAAPVQVPIGEYHPASPPFDPIASPPPAPKPAPRPAQPAPAPTLAKPAAPAGPPPK